MQESEKETELKVFSMTDKSLNSLQLLSPKVTVNQILYTNPHHEKVPPSCCMDGHYFFQSPYRGGHVGPESWSRTTPMAQHMELMHHRELEDGGGGLTRINFPLHPPDARRPHPAETRHIDMTDLRRECSYWDCGLNWCGTMAPANRDRTG